jgi:hypothetical protein
MLRKHPCRRIKFVFDKNTLEHNKVFDVLKWVEDKKYDSILELKYNTPKFKQKLSNSYTFIIWLSRRIQKDINTDETTDQFIINNCITPTNNLVKYLQLNNKLLCMKKFLRFICFINPSEKHYKILLNTAFRYKNFEIIEYLHNIGYNNYSKIHVLYAHYCRNKKTPLLHKIDLSYLKKSLKQWGYTNKEKLLIQCIKYNLCDLMHFQQNIKFSEAAKQQLMSSAIYACNFKLMLELININIIPSEIDFIRACESRDDNIINYFIDNTNFKITPIIFKKIFRTYDLNLINKVYLKHNTLELLTLIDHRIILWIIEIQNIELLKWIIKKDPNIIKRLSEKPYRIKCWTTIWKFECALRRIVKNNNVALFKYIIDSGFIQNYNEIMNDIIHLGSRGAIEILLNKGCRLPLSIKRSNGSKLSVPYIKWLQEKGMYPTYKLLNVACIEKNREVIKWLLVKHHMRPKKSTWLILAKNSSLLSLFKNFTIRKKTKNDMIVYILSHWYFNSNMYTSLSKKINVELTKSIILCLLETPKITLKIFKEEYEKYLKKNKNLITSDLFEIFKYRSFMINKLVIKKLFSKLSYLLYDKNIHDIHYLLVLQYMYYRICFRNNDGLPLILDESKKYIRRYIKNKKDIDDLPLDDNFRDLIGLRKLYGLHNPNNNHREVEI